MDSTVIVAVFSMAFTLIGSLAGPYLAHKFTKAKELEASAKSEKRDPYINFTVCVEKLQRDADKAMVVMDHDMPITWLDEMEYVRARIDIVGSYQARVWAYRCRLALDGIAKAIPDAEPDVALFFRDKLHEARSAFVRNVRHELEVAATVGVSYRPAADDGLKEEDLRLRQTRISTADHVEWLDAPADAEGETPGAFALEQIRSIVLRVTETQRPIAEPDALPSPSEGVS